MSPGVRRADSREIRTFCNALRFPWDASAPKTTNFYLNSHMKKFAHTPVQAVQEYWDRRPCNVHHSAAPMGTCQYFDEVERRKHFVEPHIPAFAQFDRWKGKRVLEIGCGIGTATVCFARSGAYVTAVDLSEKSLAILRQRLDVYRLADRVTIHQANAEELCRVVPPEDYDLIYSFGVIHHTPHPDRVIDQIRNHYARPGTALKVMVYNRYSWKVLGILASYGFRFWELDELVARHSEAQTGCPITYSYGPKQLVRLIGPKFRIKEMFIEHIFPYQVKEYTHYQYVKEWYFRHMPKRLFRGLERTIGWHLCATAEYEN